MEDGEEYRLIWFQHLHKSAGTVIINMAIANKEILFPHHNNGNPKEENGEILPLWEYNKIQLIDFVNKCEKEGVTFIATEYGSPDFEILSEDPRITLITCIRDPENRIVSNYNYDYYSGYTNVKTLEKFINVPNVYTSDNYYVRVFSRTTALPLKTINKEEYMVALDNISKFNIIINTENNNLEEKLRDGLGWKIITNKNHATFGDKWKIINMIKRLQISKLIKYLRKESMSLDLSCLTGRFDMDYELISEIFKD
tara:strand:+ start:1260 stop:2024 length:765 start_codon:yes stop_codon:yes gene_type:complete